MVSPQLVLAPLLLDDLEVFMACGIDSPCEFYNIVPGFFTGIDEVLVPCFNISVLGQPWIELVQSLAIWTINESV